MSQALAVPARTCRLQKIPYSSRAEANVVAREARRFGRSQWPYQCRWCHAWHLTSKKPW